LNRLGSDFVMSEVQTNFDDLLDVPPPHLDNMVVGVPPVFEGLTRELGKIVEQPLLGPKAKFPPGERVLYHHGV
jgi:tubulin gamma